MVLLASLSLAFADPVAELRTEGCLACHDAGTAAGVGPPLGSGLAEVEVTTAGATRTVPRDEAYLLRAMTDPEADVRVGYPAHVMAAVGEAKARALLPALQALGPDSAPARGGLAALAVAVLAFAAGHLGLSARSLRGPGVRRFGLGAYLGMYSLVIGVAFAAMVWTWSRAPFVPLWAPAPWMRWVPFCTMPFVLLAQVAGYSTPSPTLSGQGGLLDKAPTPRGIQWITRHPVNVSSSFWALAHCFPNGDVASLLLFGGVGLLGILGSYHIDRRLAAEHGEAWASYAAQTSLWPFAGIVAGKGSLGQALREIGVVRILITVGSFVGVLYSHTWIIGASPWPWG